MVKTLPAMQETRVQSLGWDSPLEKEMAIPLQYSSVLVPWTEEPGGPQPMDRKESDGTELTQWFMSCLKTWTW